MSEQTRCHSASPDTDHRSNAADVDEALRVLQRDLTTASSMAQRMSHVLESMRAAPAACNEQQILSGLNALQTGLVALSTTCGEGQRLVLALANRLLDVGAPGALEAVMNFQARDPLPNKKNSPGPFISNNYRQTVQGPAEKLVDLLRLHLHQLGHLSPGALYPKIGQTDAVRTRPEHAWLACKEHPSTPSDSAELQSGTRSRKSSMVSESSERSEHKGANLAPPQSPPRAVSAGTSMHSHCISPEGQHKSDADLGVHPPHLLNPTPGAHPSLLPHRPDLAGPQVDELIGAMSTLLNELEGLVVRGCMWEQMRGDVEANEYADKVQELKEQRRLYRQLERQVERARKEEREKRQLLVHQHAALERKYQALLDSTEELRAKHQAQSCKYDELVVKSVTMIQQLEAKQDLSAESLRGATVTGPDHYETYERCVA